MATHQILGKDDQACLAQMLKAAGPLPANLGRLLESVATALAQGSVLQWEAGNFPMPTTETEGGAGASEVDEEGQAMQEGEVQEGEAQEGEVQEGEVQEGEAQGGEAQDGDPETGQAGEAGRGQRMTKKKCRRGAQPYAPKLDRRRRPQIVGGDTVEAMVAELAAAHPLSESFNPKVWAEGIRKGLACQEVPKSASGNDGLFCVISRCFLMTGQDVTVNFLLMVNYISLVTQCQRSVFPISPCLLSQRVHWQHQVRHRF